MRKQLILHVKERLKLLREQLCCSHRQRFIFRWVQVIDCRRVLKWTYAYGFYAFDLGDTIEDEYSNSLTAKSHLVREEREQRIKNQKDFFEFSQVPPLSTSVT